MRFLLFVALVIALGVGTIKLKRKNKETMRQAFRDLADSIPDAPVPTTPMPVAEQKEPESPAYIRPREVDRKDVIIPESLPFKEAIEILMYMADKYPEEMQLAFYEPASDTTLALFEERTGIRFTEELKALYRFSNGLDIGMWSLLTFESLEQIEREYNMGYCDWAKEGDANDYLLIGDVIGDGEYLALHKESGHIFWHDEGNMTDYQTVENLLQWAIGFIYEGNIGKGDDPRIDRYLEG